MCEEASPDIGEAFSFFFSCIRFVMLQGELGDVCKPKRILASIKKK